MFFLLAIIGTIGSIVLLGGMVASGCQDPTITTAFISMLVSTILCFNLVKMNQKISDNEDEIKKLKKHFGIKDGDPVNQNNDNQND